MRFGEMRISVSHTTRAPRGTEQDGREYHFVSKERFAEMAAKGEFVERAVVHENLYGTSVAETQNPGGVIFDVDHQGARRLKAHSPGAVSVFVLPPSLDALKERLVRRATDSAEIIERRLSAALGEISHYDAFDYLLVNDDLEIATSRLASIVEAEQCRRWRTAEVAERLLA